MPSLLIFLFFNIETFVSPCFQIFKFANRLEERSNLSSFETWRPRNFPKIDIDTSNAKKKLRETSNSLPTER